MQLKYKKQPQHSDGPGPIGNYNIKLDSQKRPHVEIPNQGPVFIFNRSNNFYTSNIECHLNDISSIMKNNFPSSGALGLTVDKGGDWAWHVSGSSGSGKSSVLNIFEFGKLWMDLKLNILLAISYIPENHHQNRIEHAWGPRTNDLAGVHFKPNVSHLSREDRAKELDKEIDILTRIWGKDQYCGFPITCHSVPCIPESPAQYRDIEELSKLLKSNNIPEQERGVLKFLLAHMVKYSESLLIMSCDLGTCDHCSKISLRAPKLLSCLQKFKTFPFTPRDGDSGHYHTFFELYQKPELSEHPPPGIFGFSDDMKYLFSSMADKKRYHSVVYGNLNSMSYTCGWEGCSSSFSTNEKLKRHKEDANHKRICKQKIKMELDAEEVENQVQAPRKQKKSESKQGINKLKRKHSETNPRDKKKRNNEKKPKNPESQEKPQKKRRKIPIDELKDLMDPKHLEGLRLEQGPLKKRNGRK